MLRQPPGVCNHHCAAPHVGLSITFRGVMSRCTSFSRHNASTAVSRSHPILATADRGIGPRDATAPAMVVPRMKSVQINGDVVPRNTDGAVRMKRHNRRAPDGLQGGDLTRAAGPNVVGPRKR